MRATFRLGRIAGIRVGANWSVALVFGAITWGVAAGRFPARYPGRPVWAYAATGVGTAVVFGGCLLLHELAHAVVARRNHIAVDEIVLWLFGGVARLRGQAADPGAEFRLAGAGPAVSLAVATGLGAAAGVVAVRTGDGLAVGALEWLAAINVALALFNSVPAAPLDGGRMLRAALWRWRGDRTWAAVAAARAGQALGCLLVGVGAWQALAAATLGGVWLAMLGWFLTSAATLEIRHERRARSLAGLRVGDLMSPHPYAAAAGLRVSDLVDDYAFGVYRRRITAVPLLEDGRPAGLVTVAAIEAVAPHRRRVTSLSAIARPLGQVPVATPDDDAASLLGRLDGGCAGARALVVGPRGQLVGMVEASDLARAAGARNARPAAGGPRGGGG